MNFFRLLLCTLIIFNGSLLFSQAAWGTPSSFGNSNYYPNKYNDVDFTTSTNAFAVGDGGSIITTSDQGVSWTSMPSPSTENYNNIHFLNALEGIIVGDVGTVLVTIDGGLTWELKPITSSNNYFAAYILSANNYLVGGDFGQIFATTDGGDTWVLQSNFNSSHVKDITFLTPSDGYAVSSGGTISYTTNGGANWLPRTSPIFNNLKSLHFPTALAGWAVGEAGKIVTTADGGVTWTEQSSLTTDIFYDCYFEDEFTGWAACEGGLLYKTVDGGLNWNIIDMGFGTTVNAIDFSSTTDVVAVGNYGFHGVSTDAADTWTSNVTTVGTSSFLSSVFMITDSIGWCSGTGGVILKTTDGGTNWNFQASNVSESCANIFFLDENTGWVCGSNGTHLKTINGGVTWADNSDLTTNSYNSIHFNDINNGWCVGATGIIRNTVDGGLNWSTQTSGTTQVLNDVHFANNLEGWIAGANGVLLHTTDGGSNWVTETSGVTASLMDVYFNNSTDGWAVGHSGSILQTIDGGVTWTQPATGFSNIFLGVDFVTPSTGWAVDLSGQVTRTIDGGASWNAQNSNNSTMLSKIDMTSNVSGIAVGQNGTIIKYECVTPTPSGLSSQSYCYDATLSDLTISASEVKWYATALGGIELPIGTVLLDGQSYFASQTIDGCESKERFEVVVTIDNGPAAPTASATQTFCFSATLDQLEVQGDNLIWYAAATGASIIDSQTSLLDGQSYFVSQSIAGCESNSRTPIQAIVNNQGNEINATVTPTAASCGDKDGSASTVISGGTTPYNIIWDNGSQTTSTDSLTAGLHYITIEDNLNCSIIKSYIITTSGSPLITTDNITDNLCANESNGSIDISVTGGQSPYSYEWSNNANIEDISNLAYGCYEVLVTDNNGCASAEVFFVDEPSPLFANYEVTQPTCLNSDGAIQLTTIGGVAPYIYNWSNSSLTESIATISAGVYSIEITDNNGCIHQSDYLVNDIEGVLVNLDSVELNECSTNMGSAYLSSTGTENTYLWSNSQITEDLENVTTGSYTLEVTSIEGCKTFKTLDIQPTISAQPELCVVTVDELSQNNVLIWEKDASQDIASYNIYKESCIYGVYHLVHTQPFIDESLFEDSIANTENRGWRYKISSVNSCGIESERSEFHRAIQLMAVINSTTIDLLWNDYEGITVTSHDIYRESTENGLELINSASVGSNFFTDTPTGLSNLSYVVTTDIGYTCTSAKANTNTSRSNKKQSISLPDASEVTDNQNQLFVIYPNPTTGKFKIAISNEMKGAKLSLINAIGAKLKDTYLSESNIEIDLTAYENGVYFLQIDTKEGVITRKLIKN